MTLIISLISKKVVAHVSDTRHTYINTRTNKIVSHKDSKVKSIVILGDAGCFSISYCGRGEIDGIRTDRWLTNLMTDFGAGKKRIEETIAHLTRKLKEKSDEQNEYHKISISISGFSILGKTVGVCHYLISNYEKQKGQKLIQGDIGEFKIFFPTLKLQSSRRPYAIIVNGEERATENKLFNSRIKKTIKLLQVWRPTKNDVFKLSLRQLISIAASDKSFGSVISKSCIVTIIPTETWEPDCTFFNDSNDQENIAPHVIGSNIAFRDIIFSGAQGVNLRSY